ncbi:MAG TPA: mechanosensitive ion channel family protein [Candidatus Krumholzibacteria bacterium]|nr:mechanosensitive ion channel family protein [Candidatus Krumholzibacteria bacterium]
MTMPKVSIVFAACLLVATAPSATAQPTVARTDSASLSPVLGDSVGTRSAELVAGIRRDVRAVDTYLAKLETASREDSVVLRLQLFETQQDALTKLHELAGVLIDLEKRGPQPGLRTDVVGAFERTTPRIWGHIRMIRGQIDRLRAARGKTAAADRPALEGQVRVFTQRLDTVYQLGYDQLQLLGTLGIGSRVDSTTYATLLLERADELSGRIAVSTERISEYTGLQRQAPDNADVRALLAAEKISLKTETSSMALLIPLLGKLNLPSGDYRSQLLVATRDLSSGLLNKDALRRLLADGWSRVRAFLRTNGASLLARLLACVGILLGARLLGNVVQRIVQRTMDRKNTGSVLLRRMVVQGASNAVFLIGVLLALGQLGINVGPMVAGLGVAGFIVGFALQDTLANFAAGMMILLYRPYDVGDVVEVTGALGKVERMSLVSTNVVTFDNQMIVVPNSKIWGDVIKNVTHQSLRRVDMVFGISYADDIPKAETVLMDILRAHDKVLQDPAPVVKVNRLNDSSVDFVVRPWVAVDDYWDVYWDVTREVKMRFDREGISIPFPQRDVHLYQNAPSSPAGPAV